jgi:hypothetical protein
VNEAPSPLLKLLLLCHSSNNICFYSTRLLASTTLRNILGTKSLSEILSDRELIAKDILAHLDSATDDWGIKVFMLLLLLFMLL